MLFSGEFSLLKFSAVLSAVLLLVGAQETVAQEQVRERRQELAQQVRLQRGEIERLRSQAREEGGYDYALAEAQLGLGRLLAVSGEHEEAVEAYGESLQLSRVGFGLYSQQQLPAIVGLIESRTALQEWREVDDLYEMNLDLAQHLYGAAEPGYLHAAQDYGRWRLRTVSENLLRQSDRARLAAAAELSDFYAQVIAAARGASASNADLLPLLMDQSEADLTSATAVVRTGFLAFDGTAPRIITQTRCQPVRGRGGQVSRQCYNEQVENPRYRESQYQAKRLELERRLNIVENTAAGLQSLLQASGEAGLGEDAPEQMQAQVAAQIARLRQESEDIRALARRERLF